MSLVNFDGIPGPTHSYTGLAEGNLASTRSAQQPSHPREAALQGLAKMRVLAARGFAQAVLPPQERPDLAALRALGFFGSDHVVLAAAARDAPQLLAACSSAAAMWVANAATVSPSADTADGRVHFTPANLCAQFHRSLEAATTTAVLRAIFADRKHFVVHDALPSTPQFSDEGAANHLRFVATEDEAGVEMFVYGRRSDGGGPRPSRFPARQSLGASETVARHHGLTPQRTVHAQQHPAAIDAGVFHNDVIAVGEGAVLLCHERAWVDQDAVLRTLAAAIGPSFTPIVVRESEVSLDDAVATYLFNSQLLPRADGQMLLVMPAECAASPTVSAWLDRVLTSGGPLAEVLTVDLRESMHNGGGPACLRLRVSLTPGERAAISANVFLSEALAVELDAWIRRHYRESLVPADLADPALLDESRRALDELSQLLRIGSVYPFQRSGPPPR